MLTPEQDELLKSTVADALSVDMSDIDDSTSPETLPAWTSLRHLNLMVAVEEAFGLTLSMEEMASVKSYGDLARMVSARAA